MKKEVTEIAEASTVQEANGYLKEGWELYKLFSHQEKVKIILVKRG